MYIVRCVIYTNVIVPSSVERFGPKDLNTSGSIQIPEVTDNFIIQLHLEVPHQFQMIGVLLGDQSTTTVTIVDDTCMLTMMTSIVIVAQLL